MTFWARKKDIRVGGLGPIELPPMPAKREFCTMLELLKDAEKYDVENEYEVSSSILSNLKEYISQYQQSVKQKI